MRWATKKATLRTTKMTKIRGGRIPWKFIPIKSEPTAERNTLKSMGIPI
jgi:hypothetical protein